LLLEDMYQRKHNNKDIMKWCPNALKGEQLDISGPALDVCHANWVRTRNLCLDMDGTSIATATTDGIDALWLAHHGIIEII
jgi:hypothetical protein